MGSLTTLTLIWAAIFVANILARKTRLTPVLWYLLAGSLLINLDLPSGAGDPFIGGLASLGIILIMFALGFEENTGNFLASIRRSWGIAFFGALAPFTAAYFLSLHFWGDVNVALMCGLTMTATAVSLTMVVLKSENLGKSPVATRIMTSAILDDIASLALVAILVPLAVGEGPVNIISLALIVTKAILFFILVSLLGAWLLPHRIEGWLGKVPLLGTYGFRHLIEFGRHSTLTVLILAMTVGMIAHEFGFHPAIGAYMAGLVIREEYFTIQGSFGSFIDTKRIVENIAFTWIGPVFFVHLGTQLVFDGPLFLSLLPEIGTFLAAIFVAQILSAALAARFTAGLNWAGSWMVGCGMLGRAELAFVVIDIAYVQNSILDKSAFYVLMATAFALNLLVPLTLSLCKPFYLKALSEGDPTPDTGAGPEEVIKTEESPMIEAPKTEEAFSQERLP